MGADVVELVVVVDLPAKSSVPVPSTSTATIPTMTTRRVVWRRLVARCISSIF
jgi:hypothetical protein